MDELSARKRLLRIRAMTAAFLLVLVLAVKVLWPAGTAKMRAVLTGDRLSEMQQAWDQCALDIGNGAPVRDALTVFCRQVMFENEE